MSELRFRILNVFAIEGQRLSGNPLCVFEDGSDLDDATMQALARQFNLSETTFILPRTTDEATARVRIFTPTFEMPFAGHPTLGTAHVVRSSKQPGVPAGAVRGRSSGASHELRSGAGFGAEPQVDRVLLEMKAGLVEVIGTGARWKLRTARPLETRSAGSSEALATMLGLGPEAIVDTPLWVDTGAEQLVIPLATAADVRRARPSAELLATHARSERRGASMAYVWAPVAAGEILARFFFLSDGGVIEDPATGSACANLGGWHVARGRPLPVALEVRQGDAIARPSLLWLEVDAAERIFVSGAVEELGTGTLHL